MSRTLRFRAPFSRLFLKSLSLDMIDVARDRGIVHIIVHVQEYHLIARDPGIVVLYSEEVTCSLMIGWSIVEP